MVNIYQYDLETWNLQFREMDFTVKEETFCVLQENICKFKYCDLGDFRNLNGCVNMNQASWWFWSGFFEYPVFVFELECSSGHIFLSKSVQEICNQAPSVSVIYVRTWTRRSFLSWSTEFVSCNCRYCE